MSLFLIRYILALRANVFVFVFVLFLVFVRSIVDEKGELIFLFGGKGNTSQVQVFDKKDNNVKRFYLRDIDGAHLDQSLNFVPLLFENMNDDTDKSIFLMGGETERFVPQSNIFVASLQDLDDHYLNELKQTIPLQSLGAFQTISQNQITVQIQINLITNTVYITLDGPATKWFAIGFNAKRMGDNPYTIFVYQRAPNMLIEERKLANRGPGDLLSDQTLTIESYEEYTTKIDGKDVEYRTVQLKRNRVGITPDHFSFPSEEGEVSIIYAHGNSDGDTLNYHWTEKDSGVLLFLQVPCKINGAVCDQLNVDYCCDSSAGIVCDDVTLFDLHGAPTTEIRCCIPNTDLTTACFMDAQCCGDYVCSAAPFEPGGGTCGEPQCLEDGHVCDKQTDCCERDIARCDAKFDAFFNSVDVCCIDSVDDDSCVVNGCCGMLQCDPSAGTCRYGMGATCQSDDQCLTGLVCGGVDSICIPAPTQEPTASPTRRYCILFFLFLNIIYV